MCVLLFIFSKGVDLNVGRVWEQDERGGSISPGISWRRMGVIEIEYWGHGERYIKFQNSGSWGERTFYCLH